MKTEENNAHKFDSLSDIHKLLGLPKPLHPLISLMDNMDNRLDVSKLADSHILRFYKISYKANLSGKLKYGQNYYDFDEGGLFFVSPNQLIGRKEDNGDHSGYTLLIHPDFFWSYPLSEKIKKYGFFKYSANEALHLSENEKATIITIFKIIEEELKSRIDDYSQDVVISQIELLLNYSNRFYKRQFITRKKVNSGLLEDLEKFLDDYFDTNKAVLDGIPTVHFLAEKLHMSPNYLSDMLRSLTGQNAQQHIHNRLIEKAKEKLSTTELSISEIAYELGFEHSQSFNRLFKAKTKVTPLKFRASFN